MIANNRRDNGYILEQTPAHPLKSGWAVGVRWVISCGSRSVNARSLVPQWDRPGPNVDDGYRIGSDLFIEHVSAISLIVSLRRTMPVLPSDCVVFFVHSVLWHRSSGVELFKIPPWRWEPAKFHLTAVTAWMTVIRIGSIILITESASLLPTT